jgi:hypothetical protein
MASYIWLIFQRVIAHLTDGAKAVGDEDLSLGVHTRPSVQLPKVFVRSRP